MKLLDKFSLRLFRLKQVDREKLLSFVLLDEREPTLERRLQDSNANQTKQVDWRQSN